MTLTVASIAALIAATGTVTPAQVQVWVRESAIAHGLPVARWMKQIEIESHWQYDLVTPIPDTEYFAFGPAQLHLKWHDPVKYAHPRDNLMCGADEMRTYLSYWHGDWPKALASYCHGFGNVRNLVEKHSDNWRKYLSKDVNAYVDRIIAVKEEETPMATVPSKLSLHLIPIPPWIKEAAGPYVKAFNPPARFAEVIPQSKLILRYYGPDKDGHDWNWQERDLVARRAYRQYFDACRRFYDEQAGAWAIEFVNEPPIATPQERTNLSYTLDGWVDLMRQHYPAFRLIGGNFSVGWPAHPDMTSEMVLALSKCDFVGVHEYWRWPYELYLDLITHYRRAIVEPFAQSLVRMPQIIVTECGLTQAVMPGFPDKGWRAEHKADGSALTETEYLGMLERYNTTISQDPCVLTACVYTVADEKWKTFDISKSMALKMRAFTAPSPQPEPLPQPTNDVQLVQRIRDAGWQMQGIPHNAVAALTICARAHNLGAPLSHEYTAANGYLCQNYTLGIVYCPVFQWDKCEVTKW